MRLIDADALADVIEGTDWYHLTEIGTMAHGAVSGDNAWFREGDIFKALAEAPTIDAVPVVRCRDCVNGELCLNAQGSEYVVCSMDEHHVWLPNGFCSYGELKDGDGDDGT